MQCFNVPNIIIKERRKELGEEIKMLRKSV